MLIVNATRIESTIEHDADDTKHLTYRLEMPMKQYHKIRAVIEANDNHIPMLLARCNSEETYIYLKARVDDHYGYFQMGGAVVRLVAEEVSWFEGIFDGIAPQMWRTNE
jgi:hypothetical protein